MALLIQPIAPVILLDRQTVSELLTLPDCISAVEAAFSAHARAPALTPGLLHVDADGGEFHIKVGGLRGTRTYFAAKINGGFFGNRANLGLPNIIGLIILSNGSTGVPLAVMESGFITRLRTGAATAVAAKYLARPASRTVTVCGAGNQGEIQLRSLKEVLPIDRAFIWSRSGADAFAHRMSEVLQIDVRPAPELAEATLQSDVIVTCTQAKAWYLGRQHVRPGTFIAAVGSDSPDKQEIEPELTATASVVPDLLNQAAQAGDLHHAIAAGLMLTEGVRGELGQVILGAAPRRVRDDEIIIFDSTGTALQDCAAAALIYERALSFNRGLPFEFWR